MNIHLSDHFTCRRLLRFTLPSVTMMVFTSVYVVVDGFFVSNFVGKTAFAAVTIIFPFLGILGAAGFMFGAGGAAIVGKFLGEGHAEKACRSFSLFVGSTALSGFLLTILGELFLEPIAILLGAEGETLSSSLLYGRITILSLPFFMLQFCFQPFFITAEKPKLGLCVTVLAGLSNMVLDVLLIMVFDFGLAGAAFATVVSEVLGGSIPVLYFMRRNTSLLSLTRPLLSLSILLKGCCNGASEFLINIAYPMLMAVYNYQLLRLAGEDGVAAFGVILYVSFVFTAIFLGYASGSAPLVSYNLGACNWRELQNIFAKSVRIVVCAGLLLSSLSFLSAGLLAALFTGYDAKLCAMTQRAIMLYSPVFLLSGINIYGSSFFTALNDGLVSALISLLRSVVFGLAAILVMPLLFGLTGVWISWVVAEGATLFVTLFFFRLKNVRSMGQ
ncbi:MAG: polysaccharide biosynthesis C-terminal domain-containing protein [Desulfovibrio sp.]|nr:polysaccharide biosynthesis C-terminal domain-containing protein [Desulfovibrio sp.]